MPVFLPLVLVLLAGARCQPPQADAPDKLIRAAGGLSPAAAGGHATIAGAGAFGSPGR
jgi:hypothetical protein